MVYHGIIFLSNRGSQNFPPKTPALCEIPMRNFPCRTTRVTPGLHQTKS